MKSFKQKLMGADLKKLAKCWCIVAAAVILAVALIGGGQSSVSFADSSFAKGAKRLRASRLRTDDPQSNVPAAAF